MELKLRAWICSKATLNFISCDKEINHFLTFTRKVNRKTICLIFVHGSLWDAYLINYVCYMEQIAVGFSVWCKTYEVCWYCRRPSNEDSLFSCICSGLYPRWNGFTPCNSLSWLTGWENSQIKILKLRYSSITEVLCNHCHDRMSRRKALATFLERRTGAPRWPQLLHSHIHV